MIVKIVAEEIPKMCLVLQTIYLIISSVVKTKIDKYFEVRRGFGRITARTKDVNTSLSM